MKQISLIMTLAGCAILLCSCGGPSQSTAGLKSKEGLSDRLNRSYGYEVDDNGNWLPKTDKRSQYEGRGGSAYFNGNVGKKSYHTQNLSKGSWMGGQQVRRPSHHVNGSKSTMSGSNRLSSQQASLNTNLQTPERIHGNHLPDRRAHETNGDSVDKPSNAAISNRRGVFVQPEVIDYRQQRELSIRESRQLLGRDD